MLSASSAVIHSYFISQIYVLPCFSKVQNGTAYSSSSEEKKKENKQQTKTLRHNNNIKP